MVHSYNLRPKPKRYDQKYKLGIEIDNCYMVTNVFGNSAINSGIKKGDILSKIGSKTVSSLKFNGFNIEDIKNLFIGSKNTKVNIVVDRQIKSLSNDDTIVKVKERLKFVLKRDNVVLGAIGVISISDNAIKNNNIIIVTIIDYVKPNKPAHGFLKYGDHITHVNGECVDNYDISRVANLIKGPVGSNVNITISRKHYINNNIFSGYKTYEFSFIRE